MKTNMGKTENNSDVIKYALPAAFDELCSALTIIIDSKMVAPLGVTCIAAVSVSSNPKMFALALFSAVNTVLSSAVAFYLGRGDRDKANGLFVTAGLYTLVLSAIVGIISLAFAGPVIDFCSGQADIRDMAIDYFRITMGLMMFNNLFLMINSALRGCGKTGTALLSDLISNIVNIIMNYMLIEGHCGFRAMGISGAALATVIGTAAALLFDIVILFRDAYYINLVYIIKNKIHATREYFDEIFEKWKTVVVENLLLRVAFLIIGAITARIGSFELSVYSVCQQLLNVSAAIGRGFQSAAVALIGRSRGEDNSQRIKNYSQKINVYSIGTAAVTAVLMVLCAKPYSKLFSQDPVFIEMGFIACLCAAASSFFQIPRLTLTGFLQGMSQMKETRKCAVISVCIVQLVALFILVLILKMGLNGVLISLVLSQTVWFISTYSSYKTAVSKLYSQ